MIRTTVRWCAKGPSAQQLWVSRHVEQQACAKDENHTNTDDISCMIPVDGGNMPKPEILPAGHELYDRGFHGK